MIARSLAGLTLALLLSACSPGPTRDAPDDEMLGLPGCFNIRDVQNFRVIDSSRLIVFAPNDSRAYQLRISPPSAALRGAPGIAFDSRSGRICGRAGDRIYFDAPGGTRYSVTDVRRLDQLPPELRGGEGGAEGAGLEPQTDSAAEIEPLPGARGEQADEPQEAGEP